MRRREESSGPAILALLFVAAVLGLARPAVATPNSPCPLESHCPVCGDGICDDGEFCPEDCDPQPISCGNGICEVGESCSTCPSDCGACAPPIVCGNGVCQPGETCSSCSADCGTCPKCDPPQACKPVCPNGVCEVGETCNSCAVDCGGCVGQPVCGDGVCDSFSESCNTCSADCCPNGGGEGQMCFGDFTCFALGNFGCDRDTHTCCSKQDATCNAPHFCGDGVCQTADETCGSCPGDCCNLGGGGALGDPCFGSDDCSIGLSCDSNTSKCCDPYLDWDCGPPLDTSLRKPSGNRLAATRGRRLPDWLLPKGGSRCASGR